MNIFHITTFIALFQIVTGFTMIGQSFHFIYVFYVTLQTIFPSYKLNIDLIELVINDQGGAGQ